MTHLRTFSFLVLFWTLCVPSCFAEYEAIGPFEGDVCKGVIIKICSLVTLDAIEKDGKFYEIHKVWENVDDFKTEGSNNTGRCFLRLKSGGALSFIKNKPKFYRYNSSGNLEPVDVEGYVTFKCRKW